MDSSNLFRIDDQVFVMLPWFADEANFETGPGFSEEEQIIPFPEEETLFSLLQHAGMTLFIFVLQTLIICN